MEVGRIRLFEEEIGSGLIYPCSLVDIRDVLMRLPEPDTVGLHSVGLAVGTKRTRHANAAYFLGPPPRILLYALPNSLDYSLGRRLTKSQIAIRLSEEIQYGMKTEVIDGVAHALWNGDALRKFVLNHVLPHEIGHHVYRYVLKRQLSPAWRDFEESEKFAEHYAIRWAQGRMLRR